MTFPSLYRAKAVNVRSGAIEAFVPQVYGETTITITDALGNLPDVPTMGWVFFQAGNPEFPVWSSGFGVGADGEDWSDEIASLQATDVAYDARLDALEAGGGGGGGTDEVWVGPTAPSDPNIELWYDSDAPSPSNIDRWNSAWGIIATGTFIPPLAPHVITVTDTLTYPLTATLITGRRYMVRLQLRATAPTGAAGNVSYYIRDNGVDIRGWQGGGDPYVYTAGAYQGLNYGWLFTGDNTSHSFEVRVAPSASFNIYTDYAHYYIEDMGPISYGIPPAVDPTPTSVAWTPLVPINGWISPGGVTEMSVGIRKIGDICYLKGSLQVGSTVPTLGQAAFSVPAGYYNSCLTRLPLIAFNSAGLCYPARADLSNGGVFYIQNIGGMTLSSGAFIQLMGVNWPVGTT